MFKSFVKSFKTEQNKGNNKGYAVLPYMKGTIERLQRVFRKHNVQLFSKAGYTIRNALVSPKDKLSDGEQCGIIYKYKCQVCEDTYVGETGTSLGERIKEHQKSVEKKTKRARSAST